MPFFTVKNPEDVKVQFKYIVKQRELIRGFTSKYTQEHVDAFLEVFSIDELISFEDTFQGTYTVGEEIEWVKDHAEDYHTGVSELPDYYLDAIDWEKILEIQKEDGYVFHKGFIFQRENVWSNDSQAANTLASGRTGTRPTF